MRIQVLKWQYSLTLRICAPVKRSYALLPEILDTSCGLPTSFSMIWHSSVVEESCHIGHLVVENASGTSCSVRGWVASNECSKDKADAFQYTDPCC